MTWKDYTLILLAIVLVNVVSNVGWFVYLTRAYPTMTVYVDKVAEGLTGQVNKVIQQFNERVQKLEAQPQPKEKK